MAIENWDIESKRKGGAVSQSDYIWGTGPFSFRTDVVARGCGNLPSWCDGDPNKFFDASDKFERSNGSACRLVTFSLPNELQMADWVRLVEAFVSRDIGPKPHQWAIHDDLSRGAPNPHAHIVYSDRVPDGIERSAELFFRRPHAKNPALGGCRKDSGGKSPLGMRLSILKRKQLWADLQNEALIAAGSGTRVDHRSWDWGTDSH